MKVKTTNLSWLKTIKLLKMSLCCQLKLPLELISLIDVPTLTQMYNSQDSKFQQLWIAIASKYFYKVIEVPATIHDNHRRIFSKTKEPLVDYTNEISFNRDVLYSESKAIIVASSMFPISDFTSGTLFKDRIGPGIINISFTKSSRNKSTIHGIA
jgi:hypothetical protein